MAHFLNRKRGKDAQEDAFPTAVMVFDHLEKLFADHREHGTRVLRIGSRGALTLQMRLRFRVQEVLAEIFDVRRRHLRQSKSLTT